MRPLLLGCYVAAFLYQLVAVPLYEIDVPAAGRVGPDFLLVVVLCAAILERPLRAFLGACAAGTLADVVSLDPVGTHILVYAASAWLVSWWRDGGWTTRSLPRVALFLLATAVAALARTFLFWLRAEPNLVPSWSANAAFVLYNGILAVLIYSLLETFRSRLVIPDRRRLAA